MKFINNEDAKTAIYAYQTYLCYALQKLHLSMAN